MYMVDMIILHSIYLRQCVASGSLNKPFQTPLAIFPPLAAVMGETKCSKKILRANRNLHRGSHQCPDTSTIEHATAALKQADGIAPV